MVVADNTHESAKKFLLLDGEADLTDLVFLLVHFGSDGLFHHDYFPLIIYNLVGQSIPSIANQANENEDLPASVKVLT